MRAKRQQRQRQPSPPRVERPEVGLGVQWLRVEGFRILGFLGLGFRVEVGHSESKLGFMENNMEKRMEHD